MTGFDVALIVVLIAFALLGLKHGSVWIASCLVGGFIGAYLVEYYQLPVAGMMGDFAGARLIAIVILFSLGVLLTVIPGWIVSRMATMFCVGALDKILGVLAGLVAGLIAITLAFMIFLPRIPRIERSEAWRNSRMMRPLCERLEDFFSHPSRHRATITEELRAGITEAVTPVVDKTTSSLKETRLDVEHNVSKKAGDVEKTVTKKARDMKKAVTGAK
jgi:uncharacterized membrane protein required for colicin V production